MEYSKNGLHLTEQFEGCRLKAYQDVKGVWTIGYGHTFGVTPGMEINQSEADEFLQSDLRNAISCVNRLVTVTLSQQEFDALVDFTFNLGCGLFGDSTLLKNLNAGDYQGAAQEFDRWDFAAGKQVQGLLLRRQRETTEFES